MKALDNRGPSPVFRFRKDEVEDRRWGDPCTIWHDIVDMKCEKYCAVSGCAATVGHVARALRCPYWDPQ